MAKQMLDVASCASEEIIDADDDCFALQQALA
jgi:hypothetical protein